MDIKVYSHSFTRYSNPPFSEPGSSGSIVSGYGLDVQAMEVPSPAEAKEFFL
jgi:hypothetical protein